MSTEFRLTVRPTSYTIYPGKEAMQLMSQLLYQLEYEDEYTEELVQLGYMLDEKNDKLYLHKGVSLAYIRQLLKHVDVRYGVADTPHEMKFEYDEIVPPRNKEQQDVINFISGMNEHNSNIDDNQIFLVKNPGFGKGHPVSTILPSPDNINGIKMGELKIGDRLFDHNGNPTTVTNIFDLGETDVYRVTFNDGRISYCTSEHLWNVRTKSMDHYITLTLSEMLKDWKSKRYRVRLCKPVKYIHQNVPIDPWVLGCFIGNGCLRERTLSISSGTPFIPSRIAEICGFGVRLRSVRNFTYDFYDIDTGCPILTKTFFKHVPGLIGKYSYEKTIPHIYQFNDVNIRMNLIRGLMDTDGTITNCNRVSYTSTSKKLLKQMQQIFYSFGYSATIVEDKRIDKYNSGYCGILIPWIKNIRKKDFFTISPKFEMAVRFGVQSQFKKFTMKYEEHIIKNIEFSHKEHCKCITVDNPEHLYLTEDYIVTHNTYCSGVGLCLYHKKALIIMHRDSLRTQWLNSLYKMIGMTDNEVHEISTSQELYEIAHGHNPGYDVYLMTHATFRAGLRRIGDFDIASNITKVLGIGMKIIDEAHLEFRDTLVMDYIFNVKRNLYLTATDGRSSKDENRIFRNVFENTTFYKPSTLLTTDRPSKWVEYNVVEVNTNAKQYIVRYRVEGGRGMSAVTYGKWIIQHDKNQTHFKCIRDILKLVYERDPTSKVLVFLPLIDLCTDCAYFLIKQLNYDKDFQYDLNIKTINSHNSKSENESNKHADVIVTTIGSCGTGTDIPGITCIICASPYKSSITATQIWGRIRYCGKQCYYYDIYDRSVKMDKILCKLRGRTLIKLATKTNYTSWEDDNKSD